MPVARVTSVEKKPFGLYQAVIATPTVDMSRLREVLIVLTSPEAGDAKDPAAPASSGKAKAAVLPEPVCAEDTEDCHARNRRVEILVERD